MKKTVFLLLAAAGSLGCARQQLRGLDLVGQVPSRAALAECGPRLRAHDGNCEKRTDLGRVLLVEELRNGPYNTAFGQSVIVVHDAKDKAVAAGLARGILPEEGETAQMVEDWRRTGKSDAGIVTPDMAQRSFLAPDVYTIDEKLPGFDVEKVRADLGDRFAVVYKTLSIDLADDVDRRAREALVNPPPFPKPTAPPAP